jgi:DNA modification methylase
VEHLASLVITGDAGKFSELAAKYEIPLIDYMITSPPYWNMLHAKGSKTQESRRSANDLDLFYSDNPNDLGNIDDYDQFLDQLVYVYESIKPFMRPRAYLTIIVKNVKKGGMVYPLAWDLGRRLGKIFQFKDERIWCQDDLHLFPYGYGSAWVSNTFHHYCLQFRNE